MHSSPLLLPATLLLAFANPAQEGAERARELLAEVRARGNGVPVETLEALGELRSRAGLEALETSLSILTGRVRVKAAQRALRHYAADPDLGPVAARLLAQASTRSDRNAARQAAWQLGAFAALASPQLARMLEQHEDPECREMALVHLLDAGLPFEAKALERLARSKDEFTRFALLSRLPAGASDSRPARALALARSRDAHARMAACALLAEGVSAEVALPALQSALGERDGRVRRSALVALEAVRQPAVVPILIERLEPESASMRRRLVAALERLTAQPLGSVPARWTRWWSDHAEGYELPAAGTPSEARALEPSDSRASFFRMPILSERVVFAIDSSQSMQQPMPGEESRSRFELAREQLSAAIEALPDTARFDIVHFGGRAESWKGELVDVTRRSRREALAFVDEMKMTFGTDTYSALRAALRDPEVDTVVFLTDGDPALGAVDDKNDLRRLVRHWNETRHVLFDCIAIGRERTWMKGLAQETGGRYLALR